MDMCPVLAREDLLGYPLILGYHLQAVRAYIGEVVSTQGVERDLPSLDLLLTQWLEPDVI